MNATGGGYGLPRRAGGNAEPVLGGGASSSDRDHRPEGDETAAPQSPRDQSPETNLPENAPRLRA